MAKRTPRGLIADAAGDLFGTTAEGGANTFEGGANGDGTVFEIAYTGSSYASTPTTLASFSGTDGLHPLTGMIADANGDLFGTTEQGANGVGSVFEIVKTGVSYASTPTTVASFNGANNGLYPYAILIADAAGNLFGTTLEGGAHSDGTVFEIAYTGSSYASTPTRLANFYCTGLIADAAGDLFGTTEQGAICTVFEIAKTGSTYASTPTTLASFSGTRVLDCTKYGANESSFVMAE
jgi:uncharacterized repeat protein (TIGR03803 family)